ncbi:rab11 family-interacting protein 1 isoform X1 [Thalassophryne amazonica]|uniref:rab11 family-interacting protein 1 isoform X1 n=1 Tax=Thalassophryne amazonica TaxID=390379 RepID=UPI0014718A9F|nr:rab11 family-interacting protein 1 isoform X1 [Thalassophryne amazonica]
MSSLADQSQQWLPTSVQVTVHQARKLRVKGKSGTNDAYAIMQVAKDKFSTSVAEKCVDPVWKEEASFDLPLFHANNAERCTLYIIVMHRAQVGLDKFLGQAVVNLVDLHGEARKKTDWFKLVDKSGKEDKERGEVLLDIQFMRNNMSASMFDLSMQEKSRSRISKIKDKVRGKKKDGFSDSASAIVLSVSQVLTDDEEKADAQSLSMSPGMKKKSKLKTLFAPKSNLHRNISQSMSTLGNLPEKNSSLTGSRSSGLNVDSPEGKKKFKFLGHKRTSSTDSKSSLGPFSLLGRSKHSTTDLSNTCVNGSHVYAEEAGPKSRSTLSLNSSEQSSVEDVHRHNIDASAETFTSYRPESANKTLLEQQHHQEEEVRRQSEAKRLEEEQRYKVEVKRLQEEEEERKHQEEQERRRWLLEDEARRKKLIEEEDRRRQEEERKILEEAEARNLEEEQRRQQEQAQRAEEQKRQEEASMSERLSSLFGIIRKKEEKKDELQQHGGSKEEVYSSVPNSDGRDPSQPKSHSSTNPFEDIPLDSDPFPSTDESISDHQESKHKSQTLSALGFLSRTAKVSAVKPRPHPVKPMNTVENQPPTSTTAFKDINIRDSTAGKIKMAETVESGPYGQLTQEELITLVVKQQADLSSKDAKISELEEYIDNLLVRVIEEKPTILQSLNINKPL